MGLIIESTEKTPLVHIDSEKGLFFMDGLILPEDALAFFNPILMHVGDYLKTPLPESKVILRLEYFNTASSRLLYTFLKQMNDSHHFTSTQVHWYYESDDTDLEEVGVEFEEMLGNLEFKMHPFEVDSPPVFQDLI